MATVTTPTGEPIDTQAEDERLNYASGMTLLLWAGQACVNEAGDGPAFGVNYVNHSPTDDGYAIFTQGIRSCDQGLYYQEVLLCAANRLAQVADSVGTVTWQTREPGAGGGSITVTVPPQATEDRFIARDMALHALASLARAQLITPNPAVPWGDQEKTCVEAYANTAISGNVPNSHWIFPIADDSPFTPAPLAHFPPYQGSAWGSISAAQRREIGRARLVQQAAITAAAQGLLQELTERSFEDDLAGAEKLKAAAGDPTAGLAAYWGARRIGVNWGAPIDERDVNPYNTMRHALRLLYGRLEMGVDPVWQGAWGPRRPTGSSSIDSHGRMELDPACIRGTDNEVISFGSQYGFGFGALEVMDALGLHFERRVTDIPPGTPAQARAVSMFEREGILLPDELFPGQVTPQQFRDAAQAQLIRNAAKRANIPYGTFSSSPQGEAIKATVAELSDADLRFALDRVYGLFLLAVRQGKDGPDNLGDVTMNWQAANAGLTTLPIAEAPEVSALSGAVISGGISRRALQGDVISMLGAAQAASDCGYDVALAGATEATHFAGHAAGQAAAFQDVFSLSAVLRRNLGVLRDRAIDVDQNAPGTIAAQARDLAESGLAQSTDWAGGRVIHYNRDSKYRLVVTELAPEALGLASYSEAPSRLALVPMSNGGPGLSSVFADCIAGVRTLCPTLPATHAPNAPATVAASGVLGENLPVYELTFDSAPLGFEGFLVTKKNDTTKEPGAVHGFIRKVYTGTDENISPWSKASSIVISPVQRRMAEQLFGLKPLDKAQRTCASFNPTSLPGDYCIPHMKRDMFVPLANELTSEGTGSEDSWRHYLRVAEEAAAKADELGRQLIEMGLRADERQEGAVEEVGELCGAYPTVASAKPSNGQIPVPDDDGPIAECIGEDTIDIVFLGKDPYADMTESAAQMAIVADYCTTAGKPMPYVVAPFCSRPGPYSHDGLGLGTPVEPAPTPTTQDCEELLQTFNATSKDFAKPKFGELVQKPWASQARLARTLGGVQLEQFADGEWVFALRDKPTAASSSNGVAQRIYGKKRSELTPAQVTDLDALKPLIWPWCTESMGTCSGGADLMDEIFGAPDTDALYPGVLSRIEKVLFTLGALAGDLPANTFKMYLPAIDRPSTPDDPAETEFAGPVPIPALYGAGHFKTTSGVTQLVAEGFNGHVAFENGETTTVGPAIVEVPAGYVTVRKTRALPAWLTSLYAKMEATGTKGAFRLVSAFNSKISFPENLPVPDGVLAAPNGGREANLASWLQQVGEKYDSTKNCELAETTKLLNFTTSYQKSPDNDKSRTFVRRDICTQDSHVWPVFAQDSPVSIAKSELNPFVTVIQVGTTCDDWLCDLLAGDPFFPLVPNFSLTSLVGQGTDDCSGYLDDDDLSACKSFTFTNDLPENCDIDEPWETAASDSCESYKFGSDFAAGEVRRLSPPRLRPNECPPAERLELFLDKGVDDDCEAVQSMVGALSLSCVAENGLDIPTNTGPPQIKKIEDIAKLELWIERASIAMELILQGTYLTNLPKSVVDAAKRDEPDPDAVAKGERGRLLLELGKNISDIEQGMANVTSDFRRLRSAVEKAQIDIEAADLSLEAADLELALQKLEIDRQLVQEQAAKARVFTDAIVNGLGAGVSAGLTTPEPSKAVDPKTGAPLAGAALLAGPWGAVAAVGISTVAGLWSAAGVSDDLSKDIELLKKEAAIVDQQGGGEEPGIVDGQHANRIRDAVHALNESEQSIYEALEGDLTQLQNGRANALINLNSLASTQSKARIALAKATRADYVQVGDDVIPLPVNTVLRRQTSVIKMRYDRALAGAKRAAYLARLAIEERLGTRMADLRESIGAIEAPALWVDNLCSVQGIDYDKLRAASSDEPGEGGAPAIFNEPAVDDIKGFADQYIGDYVSQLKEFVEFYNLRYPFRQGQDMALVSLREDLGHLEDQCVRESKNLLYHSDRLGSTPGQQDSSVGGWLKTGCSNSECLEIRLGEGLTSAPDVKLVPPLSMGAATWLVGKARTSITDVTVDNGTSGAITLPAETGPAPPEAVYQTVKLRAGSRYVMSWWDIARDATGGPTTDTPKAYSVSVLDASWEPVAYREYVPQTGSNWSARNELIFSSVGDGDYHVAFAIGQSGGTGASLAIANVQLEQSREDAPTASGYEATAQDRQILSGTCGYDTSEEFRKRFSYRCDSTACWHELDEMFLVDTEVLNQGFSSLVGKIATGNFNYRNGELALNVIGTGVLDCSKGNPSCYGSAYVEYDLTHYAFNVPMTDYIGDVRCFNFGAGRINSGKALAAERYLTLPLGPSDSQLVEQSAFLKPEFFGRPLSGSYRLRIKDNPALVWENVEDVQLLFRYGYWSRVDRGPGQ